MVSENKNFKEFGFNSIVNIVSSSETDVDSELEILSAVDR